MHRIIIIRGGLQPLLLIIFFVVAPFSLQIQSVTAPSHDKSDGRQFSAAKGISSRFLSYTGSFYPPLNVIFLIVTSALI